MDLGAKGPDRCWSRRGDIHLDHFIRVLGDERVMSLTDNDMAKFKQKREQESAARQRKIEQAAPEADAKPAKREKRVAVARRHVSHGTIRADFKSLKSAVSGAMTRKRLLLTSCPLARPFVVIGDRGAIARIPRA